MPNHDIEQLVEKFEAFVKYSAKGWPIVEHSGSYITVIAIDFALNVEVLDYIEAEYSLIYCGTLPRKVEHVDYGEIHKTPYYVFRIEG